MHGSGAIRTLKRIDKKMLYMHIYFAIFVNMRTLYVQCTCTNMGRSIPVTNCLARPNSHTHPDNLMIMG